MYLTEDLSNILQKSAKGSLILISAQLVSTLVSAFGTMIVAGLLDPADYGEITVAMVSINIALMFRDIGVTSALTKNISQLRHENRSEEANIILRTGLVINILVGILLTVLLFLSSGFLSKRVFDNPGIKVLIQIASIDVIGQNLLTTAKSVFAGYERMEFHSMLTVIYSILRSLAAPLLVYLDYGAFGAVVGHSSALITTGLIGLTTVLAFFSQPVEKASTSYKEAVRSILRYGFPLLLSNVVGGVLTHLNNFLIAMYSDTFSIGNYSAAANFGILITFFTLPIAITLFPLFSKLSHEGSSLRTVYQLSVKYVSIISMPIVAGMIALSDQIIGLVYPPNYDPASSFLVLYALNFTFIAMGSVGIVNLLNSQGRTDVVFKGTFLNVLMGTAFGLLLIPRYGITGLLVSQLLTKAGLVYMLHWTWRNFGFIFHLVSSVKIIFSTALSTVVVMSFLSFLNAGALVEFVSGGFLLVFIYIAVLVVLKAVDLRDVINLSRITVGLGPLTRVFKFLFYIMEFLIKVRG